MQTKFMSAGFLLTVLFAMGTTGYARNNGFNGSNVTINPTAVNFGSLNVGTTSKPVAVSVHNNSRSSVTISSVSLSLLQVTYSGPALPVTIAGGHSLSATVSFSPNAATSYTGALKFTESNGRSVSEQLSGTGVGVVTPPPPPPPPPPTPATLNLSSLTLSFGSLTVGTSASQSVTVSNGGGSNLNISGVSLSSTSAGFSLSGVSTGTILTPGQSSVLTVTFNPSAAGSVSTSVTIASNVAIGSIALSGTGVTVPVSHSASLNWSLDSSATNGYNVYSGSASGGPYTKLNSQSVMPTSYMDTAVQAGQTYYFVVTALDANNNESGYSNEVSALVP